MIMIGAGHQVMMILDLADSRPCLGPAAWARTLMVRSQSVRPSESSPDQPSGESERGACCAATGALWWRPQSRTSRLPVRFKIGHRRSAGQSNAPRSLLSRPSSASVVVVGVARVVVEQTLADWTGGELNLAESSGDRDSASELTCSERASGQTRSLGAFRLRASPQLIGLRWPSGDLAAAALVFAADTAGRSGSDDDHHHDSAAVALPLATAGFQPHHATYSWRRRSSNNNNNKPVGRLAC